MNAARRLAAAIEPFSAQVYFSPECHANYEALGFAPSPGATPGGVALPDGPAYFASRGSAMGQAPGELIASAFAVFNPSIVVPLVAHAWTITDAATIAQARTDGAIAQLVRILGEHPDGLDRITPVLQRACDVLRPEGRPLYAGLSSLGLPGHPLGAAWRLTDLLREFRGDAHTAAWTSAGFDATEIGLMSELFWGMPMGTYIFTRAWSRDDQQAAKDRLTSRGLLDGEAFTDAGRRAREDVEVATDGQMEPAIAAIGDDLDDLLDVVGGWSAAVRDAAGYLGGPADLVATR